jgi:hypothetical protein
MPSFSDTIGLSRAELLPLLLLLLLLLQNCGATWSFWAGVNRGNGLPLPVVQDTGDEDPCMDGGCE